MAPITLTWDELPCPDQNGRLLNYRINYIPVSGTPITTAVLPIGTNSLNGLMPCTNYTFMIAAENDAGVGDFSPPVHAITTGIGNV